MDAKEHQLTDAVTPPTEVPQLGVKRPLSSSALHNGTGISSDHLETEDGSPGARKIPKTDTPTTEKGEDGTDPKDTSVRVGSPPGPSSPDVPESVLSSTVSAVGAASEEPQADVQSTSSKCDDGQTQDTPLSSTDIPSAETKVDQLCVESVERTRGETCADPNVEVHSRAGEEETEEKRAETTEVVGSKSVEKNASEQMFVDISDAEDDSQHSAISDQKHLDEVMPGESFDKFSKTNNTATDAKSGHEGGSDDLSEVDTQPFSKDSEEASANDKTSSDIPVVDIAESSDTDALDDSCTKIDECSSPGASKKSSSELVDTLSPGGSCVDTGDDLDPDLENELLAGTEVEVNKDADKETRPGTEDKLLSEPVLAGSVATVTESPAALLGSELGEDSEAVGDDLDVDVEPNVNPEVDPEMDVEPFLEAETNPDVDAEELDTESDTVANSMSDNNGEINLEPKTGIDPGEKPITEKSNEVDSNLQEELDIAGSSPVTDPCPGSRMETEQEGDSSVPGSAIERNPEPHSNTEDGDKSCTASASAANLTEPLNSNDVLSAPSPDDVAKDAGDDPSITPMDVEEVMENALRSVDVSPLSESVTGHKSSDPPRTTPGPEDGWNFDFAAYRNKLKKLTRHDLEEMVLQKVIEVLGERHSLAEQTHRVGQLEAMVEKWQRKSQSVSKQVKDLNIVLRKVMNDVRTKSLTGTLPPPVKITRSVGLQVTLTGTPHTSAVRAVDPLKTPDVADSRGQGERRTVMPPPAKPPPAITPKTSQSPVASTLISTLNSPVKRRMVTLPPTPAPAQTSTRGPTSASPTRPQAPAARTPPRPAGPGGAKGGVIDLTDDGDRPLVPLVPGLVHQNRGGGGLRVLQPQQSTSATSTAPTSVTYLLPPTPAGSQRPMFIATSSPQPHPTMMAPGARSLTTTLPTFVIKQGALLPSSVQVTSQTSAAPVAAVAPLTVPGGVPQLVATSSAPQTIRLNTQPRQFMMVNRQVTPTRGPVTPTPRALNTVTRPVFSVTKAAMGRGVSTTSSRPITPATGPVTSVVRTAASNSAPRLRVRDLTQVQQHHHPAPLPGIPPQPTNPTWKQPPPRPDLKIYKVNNNQQKGIMLSWNMKLTSEYADIASYQLFAYQEGGGGHNLGQPQWKKVGDVKALPLPMACTLTQFTEGNTYHFAVRAVDIHTRVGQFSPPGNIQLTR